MQPSLPGQRRRLIFGERLRRRSAERARIGSEGTRHVRDDGCDRDISENALNAARKISNGLGATLRRLSAILIVLVLTTISIDPPGVVAASEQKSLKEQIIGTWTFVAAIDLMQNGREVDRWGANPKGILVFDRHGRYVQMIMRSDVRTFGVKSVASFGTYSVNESDKSIVTHIEGSSVPSRNGTEQKRVIISLTTDELKYTNLTRSEGARAVVWKRLH